MAAAAAPYARVMEDMVKGREYATQLQALLRDSSPEAGRLVDRILHAMSRTIDTAKAAAAAEEEASEVQSDVTCAGTAAGTKRKAAAGAADKRPACRTKRGQQSSVVTKNTKDLDDGHSWRKYGQKDIQNCKNPKAYFRCTHKYDQQCAAQRQVQRRDDDPEFYTVTYIGVHTCRDPATIVVHAAGVAAAAADDDDLRHAGSRLISFAANANANASATTTTSTTTTTTTTTGHKDAAALLARPLKLESGVGEQEEVLSSLTPAGSSAAAEATRNNPAAATPGTDQGDVTSGLQQQPEQEEKHCYGGDMAHLGYDDTIDWTALFSDSITDIGVYAEY